MDLKELLKKREEASKYREKKSIIEFTLKSYKDTKFKLKVPDFQGFVSFCSKIGIDFNASKKEMQQIFIEKVTKSNSAICEYLFDTFIEPNFTEFAGELMAELNAQSRIAVFKDFFDNEEILEIFTLVVNKQTAMFNDNKNPNIVELKKK
ncbi:MULTISPECIES: hypothetical protein [Leptotrichia]|jgi:hypothetical protein|uniref:Uncharacterized protein n=1 Tax=Leptotrichia wadei TaxID=157687 RepID=A0A510KQU2_9FUSO|nr:MULTISPECIES: hypothetical protein [Leptotrichia]NWO18170.1 hypothetical protein [Leptotrichia sp. oral taxon 223]BBM54072.1 hypothetical protein JMUB3936_0350 [Leptotrichia wadei]DAO54424.1 MAG TPA: hypothetical protein [Caudoviricetes sp.]